MVHDIQVGTILFREGLFLPDTLEVESEPFTDHWRLVLAPHRRLLDEGIRAAGWNFFFHAALTSAIAVGSRGVATTAGALKRLLAKASSQDFNSWRSLQSPLATSWACRTPRSRYTQVRYSPHRQEQAQRQRLAANYSILNSMELSLPGSAHWGPLDRYLAADYDELDFGCRGALRHWGNG